MMKDYFSITPEEQYDYATRLRAFRPSSVWTDKDIDTAISLLAPIRTAWPDIPRLKATRSVRLLSNHITVARNMIINFPPPEPKPKEQSKAQPKKPSLDSPKEPFMAPPSPVVQPLCSVSEPSLALSKQPGNLQSILDSGVLPPGLSHEAKNIKELYYAPLGRFHQQASKLVEQAIDKAAKLGFINGKYEGQSEAVVNGTKVRNPLCPDQTRQYLAEQICYYDDRLAHLWLMINFYDDNGGFKEIELSSEETRLVHKRLLDKAKQLKIPVLVIGSVGDAPADTSQYNKRTLAEILLLPDGDVKTELIRARVDRNKKLLRRSDRKPSEAHKQNVILAVEELHSQGILITEKQQQVCAHYGVTVDVTWCEPTAEERAKALAELHNSEEWKEKRKAQKRKSYDKQNPDAAIRREIRKAERDEKAELYNS